MQGITFSVISLKKQLHARVLPLELTQNITVKLLGEKIAASEFSNYFLDEKAIANLCRSINTHRKEHNPELIQVQIGESKPAELHLNVSGDDMSATLKIVSAFAGKTPRLRDVIKWLNEQGVFVGISTKRIRKMIEEAKTTIGGIEIIDLVAKGLPPRDGKPSYIKPLAPNALERILKPQESNNEKVDMRDLGAVICVKALEPVAIRMKPSKGRKGITVTKQILMPNEGIWRPIDLGENTMIDPDNENKILAVMNGLPKFYKGQMHIENVLVSNGVNVKTGNLTFDGAIIVNGDVTDQMRIESEGDVTINGFVESAYIKAKGDIIVMQGAVGKVEKRDCTLEAKGNVYVQQGQGLTIKCDANTIAKTQLAYSDIDTKGSVSVGEVNAKAGNLFGCNINCRGSISAVSVGAISGSSLTIDYTQGIEELTERRANVARMLNSLRENNLKHEHNVKELQKKLTTITDKEIVDAFQEQIDSVLMTLEHEAHLLEWTENLNDDLLDEIDDYYESAKIIAHKELYSNVNAKIQHHKWRTEREYGRSIVDFTKTKWRHIIL